MLKSLNRNRAIFISLLGLSLLFTGCGKDQLLLKTYSPPKKQKEVKQMLAVGESSTGYLNLEIVTDKAYIVNGVNSSDRRTIAKNIVADIKKFITQTNFISINDVADQSAVSLDMKILQLTYNQSGGKLNGLVEIEFNIRKGEPIYTQTYKYIVKRQSRSGAQGLPSKADILSEASQYLAKKLIKDISPLQTKKMVELASLPKELEYTLKFAQAGNFEGAIKAMNKYKGEKEYEYYLNLAIYYEGYASETDDMTYLAKANENYDLAMANGGADEEMVLKAKSKFDRFYKIIKTIAEQKVQNAKASGNSKYELLD